MDIRRRATESNFKLLANSGINGRSIGPGNVNCLSQPNSQDSLKDLSSTNQSPQRVDLTNEYVEIATGNSWHPDDSLLDLKDIDIQSMLSVSLFLCYRNEWSITPPHLTTANHFP